MAKDPIQEIKEDLQKILPLFDQLRTEINASRQSAATTKINEIQEQLLALKDRVKNDFHWLLPQEPVAQKKSSLFGLKR